MLQSGRSNYQIPLSDGYEQDALTGVRDLDASANVSIIVACGGRLRCSHSN